MFVFNSLLHLLAGIFFRRPIIQFFWNSRIHPDGQCRASAKKKEEKKNRLQELMGDDICTENGCKEWYISFVGLKVRSNSKASDLPESNYSLNVIVITQVLGTAFVTVNTETISYCHIGPCLVISACWKSCNLA